MPVLDLRPAVPEDAGAIRALSRAVYAKWVSLIGREPRPMGVDYAEAIAAHDFALLEQDGVLVALIETVVRLNHLLVVNVAVAEAAQRQGIGGALLRHAEERARALDLPELRLYTNAKMVSNLAFYARHGYAEFGRDAMPDGTDIVHLRKGVAANTAAG